MNLTLNQTKRAIELIIEESRQIILETIRDPKLQKERTVQQIVEQAKGQNDKSAWLVALVHALFTSIDGIFKDDVKPLFGEGGGEGKTWMLDTKVRIEPPKGGGTHGDIKVNPEMLLFISTEQAVVYDALNAARVGGLIEGKDGESYLIHKWTPQIGDAGEVAGFQLARHFEMVLGPAIEKRVREEVKT